MTRQSQFSPFSSQRYLSKETTMAPPSTLEAYSQYVWRVLSTLAVEKPGSYQLFRAIQLMEAKMSFSFGSMLLSEPGSADVVLLKESVTV